MDDLISARADLQHWILRYSGETGRGSLLQVLYSLDRNMEKAQHNVRAARLIEKGGTIDG